MTVGQLRSREAKREPSESVGNLGGQWERSSETSYRDQQAIIEDREEFTGEGENVTENKKGF